jgi:hypothetical protein
MAFDGRRIGHIAIGREKTVSHQAGDPCSIVDGRLSELETARHLLLPSRKIATMPVLQCNRKQTRSPTPKLNVRSIAAPPRARPHWYGYGLRL